MQSTQYLSDFGEKHNFNNGSSKSFELITFELSLLNAILKLKQYFADFRGKRNVDTNYRI